MKRPSQKQMRQAAVERRNQELESFDALHRAAPKSKKERWEYWLARAKSFKDRNDRGMDPGVVELVTTLLAHGFATENSCEGHVTTFALPYVRILVPILPHFSSHREEDAWWRTQRSPYSVGGRYRRTVAELHLLLGSFESDEYPGRMSWSMIRIETRADMIELVPVVSARQVKLVRRSLGRTVVHMAKEGFQDFGRYLKDHL